MSSTPTKVAAIAALMTLAACGGGGGGAQPAALAPPDGSSSSASAPTPAPAPAPAPASAAAPVPAPAQVLVTATSTNVVAVAQLANGGHVDILRAAGGPVYAQIFDSQGQPAGAPVAVFSSFFQDAVAVGALPDGSFLVSAGTEIYNPDLAKLQTNLYVQKVSASGQLLPTGGVSDSRINSGLADLIVSADQSNIIEYEPGPYFVNADGSYALAVRSDSHPLPNVSYSELLVSVGASGNVVGNAVDLGDEDFHTPAITRLPNGNYFFASTEVVASHGFPAAGPVTWKILTPAGQTIAQQTLGSGASAPQVATLSDGTVLLSWFDPSQGQLAEKIDSSGNIVSNAASPKASADASPVVTGLRSGGYVVTWLNGSQLLAQFFTTSGAPSGNPLVLADNVDTTWSSYSRFSAYALGLTPSGFIAVYQAADKKVYEVRVTAPPLS
jgi:hypothetical protein